MDYMKDDRTARSRGSELGDELTQPNHLDNLKKGTYRKYLTNMI